MSASLLQQIGYCCCVVYVERDDLLPYGFLKLLTGHPLCFQLQDIDLGVFALLCRSPAPEGHVVHVAPITLFGGICCHQILY